MSNNKKADDKKVIELDAYRKNWSVGIIYCSYCNRSMAHMWSSGASVVNCPECNQLIDLIIDYDV